MKKMKGFKALVALMMAVMMVLCSAGMAFGDDPPLPGDGENTNQNTTVQPGDGENGNRNGAAAGTQEDPLGQLNVNSEGNGNQVKVGDQDGDVIFFDNQGQGYSAKPGENNQPAWVMSEIMAPITKTTGENNTTVITAYADVGVAGYGSGKFSLSNNGQNTNTEVNVTGQVTYGGPAGVAVTNTNGTAQVNIGENITVDTTKDADGKPTIGIGSAIVINNKNGQSGVSVGGNVKGGSEYDALVVTNNGGSSTVNITGSLDSAGGKAMNIENKFGTTEVKAGNITGNIVVNNTGTTANDSVKLTAGDITTDKSIEISNAGKGVELTAGNIDVKKDRDDLVAGSLALTGEGITVTADGITLEEKTGDVNARAHALDLSPNTNVTVRENGITVKSYSSHNVVGINAEKENYDPNAPLSTVTVEKGGITADGEGTSAITEAIQVQNMDTNITVREGGISATGDILVTGIEVYGGNVSINVEKGGVTVTGKNTSSEEKNALRGIDSVANGGDVSIAVRDGGVKLVNSEEASHGIKSNILTDNTSLISITGNVNSGDIGIDSLNESASGKSTILVDGDINAERIGVSVGKTGTESVEEVFATGTISGGENSLFVGINTNPVLDNLSITAWSIGTNAGGNITDSAANDEKVKDHVNYILRVDAMLNNVVASAAGMFSLLSGGTAIQATQKTINDKTDNYYTAHEGESVRMNIMETVTVEGQEYKVDGVQKVGLDADGNEVDLGEAGGNGSNGFFFFKNDAASDAVAKGGGWWLRLLLTKVVPPEPETKPEQNEEKKLEEQNLGGDSGSKVENKADENNQEEKKSEENKQEENKPRENEQKQQPEQGQKNQHLDTTADAPVKSDVTTSAFDSFCNELVWKIRNAPQNGTVEADAGDFPGLMQKVFTALNDRPDVSLKLKTRDGEIMIPAGAGLLEKVSRGVVTWAEIRGLV